MKKSLFVVLAMLFVLFFNQPQASAIVTAEGWMKWDLPTGTRFGEIGIVSAREYQKNGSTTISDLFDYDNSAPFSISLTDGYSNVSTNIDASEGYKIRGQVSALSTNQGDMNYLGHAGSAGYQYIYYTGVLSKFDYSFSFHGDTDSIRDQLQFIIQAKAYYQNSQGQNIYAYSDYVGGGYVVPNYYFVTNTTNPVTYEGTFHGGDFSSFGSQSWFISYDFSVVGRDTVDSNSNNPVPEPTTMLLLGLGLVGLAGVRRKFKK